MLASCNSNSGDSEGPVRPSYLSLQSDGSTEHRTQIIQMNEIWDFAHICSHNSQLILL